MNNTQEEPLVSIITINYNQAAVTHEFLASTKLLVYTHFEIIIVDNGSTATPVLEVDPLEYPAVKIIRSERNLGFAGGNNLGMEHAAGEYCFIVNNDTELTPLLLNHLLEPFRINPTIGVVCPKIRFHHHPTVIQYAGFYRMNLLTGRTGAVGSREEDLGQHNTSGYTYSAHGAAMMVKREVIEKVGRFAEKFFLYYEESDWSARILRAGYKIYYNAQGLIYHKESISIGKDNPVKVYYLTRNRILYMRRNTNPAQLSLFLLFFTFVSLPKGIVRYAVKGQFAHLRSFLKGTFWNLTTSRYSAV
ncbi:glycosyltransferase family 2 protein [Chitinophaga costaii]|nr:glycosyltransferase family 2 protein [Chitinophaga costaii]